MRKRDKLKNIEQANLMLEQSYLKTMRKLKYVKLFESWRDGMQNEIEIYKIDKSDLEDFTHHSVFIYDYPGRSQGTTVVGPLEAKHIYYILDENNIKANVYLGPRFHRVDALSITVVYRTEEDKIKGYDIIKKNTSFIGVPF